MNTQSGSAYRRAVCHDTRPCLPHVRWTWSRSGDPRYINLSWGWSAACSCPYNTNYKRRRGSLNKSAALLPALGWNHFKTKPGAANMIPPPSPHAPAAMTTLHAPLCHWHLYPHLNSSQQFPTKLSPVICTVIVFAYFWGYFQPCMWVPSIFHLLFLNINQNISVSCAIRDWFGCLYPLIHNWKMRQTTGEDLKRDSRGRILKQSIVWVEHLLRHEEEPLPGHTTIVQSLFSLKLHPQSCLQQVCPLDWEDASVGVLQHVVSFNPHLKAVWDVSLRRNVLSSLRRNFMVM